MKRLLSSLAAAALLLLAAPPAFALKVGIVAFQMSAETQARVANAAAAAAKSKGWEVILLNSAGSTPDHATQVSNLLQANVDAIVLAMGKVDQLEEQLKLAKQRNIPVVTVSSGSNPNTVFDVNADEFVVGAKISTYFLGRLNYRGNILMQRYERHVGTRIRGKVMDTELSEYTGVKKLGEYAMAQSAAWQNDVRQGMEALLQKNRSAGIDGVWASFDGQAFIIDDLLKQMGFKKGEVVLVGVDGEQETFRRIRSRDSLFTATISVPYQTMGALAIDSIEKLVVKKVKKEDIVKGPFLFVEPILVDESNVPPEGQWPTN